MARHMPYAGELGSLQRLVSSLGANRADLGHLETSLPQLGELVAKTQDLAKQQTALTAARQEASKQLRSRTRKTNPPAPVNPEPSAPADPSSTTPAAPSR
jgi:hypothetical protein